MIINNLNIILKSNYFFLDKIYDDKAFLLVGTSDGFARIYTKSLKDNNFKNILT